MPLNQGENKLNNFLQGSTALDSIYIGDTKIWPTSILESFDADLLWTNPSPTSDFTAYRISVNYTNYDYLLVFFKTTASATDVSFTSPMVASQLIYTGNTKSKMIGSVNYQSGSTFYQYCRKLQPNSTKKSLTVFDTGYYAYATQSGGGGYSSGQANCIPLRIYGVTRNPNGKVKSLFPTWYADHPSYTGMYIGEAATTLTLSKHYKYLLIDFWTRDDILSGFSYDTNWFALNQFDHWNGGSEIFGLTAYSSSQITVLPEETTKWIAGGHRYESTMDSSMDLWRTRQLKYTGTTLSTTADYVWVCSGTKPSCNYQGGSNSGVKMIWGLDTPLW